MNLILQILSAIWQGFWGTLIGIWPTLDSLFDINHKLIIVGISIVLGVIGVPKIVRKIVEHF